MGLMFVVGANAAVPRPSWSLYALRSPASWKVVLAVPSRGGRGDASRRSSSGGMCVAPRSEFFPTIMRNDADGDGGERAGSAAAVMRHGREISLSLPHNCRTMSGGGYRPKANGRRGLAQMAGWMQTCAWRSAAPRAERATALPATNRPADGVPAMRACELLDARRAACWSTAFDFFERASSSPRARPPPRDSLMRQVPAVVEASGMQKQASQAEPLVVHRRPPLLRDHVAAAQFCRRRAKY